ncbi:FUSC family protein [Microbacterium sp. zg.Y1090]|uniref:FUSC family protein n=1 Tax=Microbacterium wangruii TaxID=3049073 RepID=UPI00214BD503|nr:MULTISPECIES: FUSC family protein [unclassified Microbacterium]MCR2817921.1 FUSC family protein [Microbacterium sp. zg.Y1090]MDL5487775.1 FUSC family protein [Microbacterium sp. zg-Y1211]WIM27914.1 FUSC family protein [Microbacterium sp. zg-Y1090]
MTHTSSRTARRPALVASLRTAGGEVVALSRLLLAAKTAVAAAVAWYLAPYVPFADAEYSYYAPMGVLVSMYPTVADSARAGMQALGGLALGILLGFGALTALYAGAPGLVAVALVIGAGVALGGIRRLGAGRDWIAIAGLFVLLLGGRHADEFSTSYIVTIAFGVLVGVVANYVLLPPLYLREAGAQLSQLRSRLAGELERIADEADAGGLDPERLGRDADELGSLAASVAEGVREAARSARANPRGRRRVGEREDAEQAWATLERVTLLVREVTEVLAQHPGIGTDAVTGRALAAALRACGGLLADVPDGPEAAAAATSAASAVGSYTHAVAGRSPSDPTQPDPAVAVAGHLSRIVQLCRPTESVSG